MTEFERRLRAGHGVPRSLGVWSGPWPASWCVITKWKDTGEFKLVRFSGSDFRIDDL